MVLMPSGRIGADPSFLRVILMPSVCTGADPSFLLGAPSQLTGGLSMEVEEHICKSVLRVELSGF